jgi:hypothetical protein
MIFLMGPIYALMLAAIVWLIYLWVDDARKAREEDRLIRLQHYYAQYGQGAISLHFIRPRRSFIQLITNR